MKFNIKYFFITFVIANLLFGFVIAQEQKNLNYYELLGVNESATPDEIEYAYYAKIDYHNLKITNLKDKLASIEKAILENSKMMSDNSAIVDAKNLFKKEFKDSQGNNVTIRMHGRVEYSPFSGKSGTTWLKEMVIIFNEGDQCLAKDIFAHEYAIQSAKNAYESLTGKKIERIKQGDFDIQGLGEKRIYKYLNQLNSNLAGLQAIIKDERRKLNLEEDRYFIFGGNHQDTSLLSPEDKIKAEDYLKQRLIKEQPRKYAKHGFNFAIGGGIVTLISLIARAIFLKE